MALERVLLAVASYQSPGEGSPDLRATYRPEKVPAREAPWSNRRRG